MKKLDLIIDLQFGSTGKGLLAGYLAETGLYDTVINANMPNAGHTYINKEGRTWIHKVLPNGIVSPNLKTVMIGPGSVFSVEQLMKEYEGSEDLLRDKVVLIHPNAVVLKPSHREAEQQNLSGISSTMQGSGAALCEKIMRPATPVIARDYRDSLSVIFAGTSIKVASQGEWMVALVTARKILGEGAQGYSLGVNTEFYPYCTSRDTTPPRFLADMGVPHTYLRDIWGTLRTFPIRVGNTSDGTSGTCYRDQDELTWEQLGQKPELTTVTQRVRRVFTFSQNQLTDALFWCRPDKLFLNFCNYIPDKEVLDDLIGLINDEAHGFGGDGVVLEGWGPSISDVKVAVSR